MAAELFFDRGPAHATALLVEGRRAIELRVEPARHEDAVERVLRGRVSNVLPGMQAAFVDLGGERNGFLHARELRLPGERLPGTPPPIQDRLKVGRDLLVQVQRESLGTKGPRLTCQLSLAGRRLVLFPHMRLRKVSGRIADERERERLERLVARLPGDDAGYVARTAAAGVEPAVLEREAERLLHEYEELERAAAAAPPLSTVRAEPDLLERMLRDAPADGLQRIVVSHQEDRRRALTYLRAIEEPGEVPVEVHQGAEPLFRAQGLQREIERALRPRVWLASGSYLVIEPTEALVSVDVNTGKFSGGSGLADTALRTNLEAAGEIARQARLRELGGLIAVDFIDMDSGEDRRRLLATLREALRRDPARTQVVASAAGGLVQILRKRTRCPPGRWLTCACPQCGGAGRLRV